MVKPSSRPTTGPKAKPEVKAEIRVAPAELDRWRENAAAVGATLSEYVIRCVASAEKTQGCSDAPGDDLAERLETVTQAVPGLRRIGVTKLQLGDLHLEIDPPPPDFGKPARAGDDDDADFLDPSKFRRRANREDVDDLDLSEIA